MLRSIDVGQSFEVSVREVGRRAVVKVTGELDLATAPELEAVLDSVVDAGAAAVWVDLTGLQFMDSSGVHVLDGLGLRMRGLNRRVAVICPQGAARTPLALSGLPGALTLVASRGGAQRRG